MPAGAKLVSSATLERRSITVTSWPSEASAWAAATPAMPAPITAIFIGPPREMRRAGEEMVQDRVRPAILFGFFWVAMRTVLSHNRLRGAR